MGPWIMVDGEKLINLILVNQMSLRELANEIGVTNNQVIDWIKGQDFPTKDEVKRIEKQMQWNLLDYIKWV